MSAVSAKNGNVEDAARNVAVPNPPGELQLFPAPFGHTMATLREEVILPLAKSNRDEFVSRYAPRSRYASLLIDVAYEGLRVERESAGETAPSNASSLHEILDSVQETLGEDYRNAIDDYLHARRLLERVLARATDRESREWSSKLARAGFDLGFMMLDASTYPEKLSESFVEEAPRFLRYLGDSAYAAAKAPLVETPEIHERPLAPVHEELMAGTDASFVESISRRETGPNGEQAD